MLNCRKNTQYLIVDTKTDKVLAWGGGPNRIVKSIEQDSHTVLLPMGILRRTIPSFKTAGVALPMFSLRSEEGFGTGKLDMLELIDWAKQTGQRIIQTLPINDTILYHTNYDSYPYNAVSV
ncbi:MAG: 4-alpha-glucanotransferase [Paludibacteraceae bacterium]